MGERFLPGVPGEQIEEIYNAAPGNEIARGKFDSPESSAALAANTFGFFLNRPGDLPPLPGCEDVEWPVSCLYVEKEVRFPWRGGRHPWLDALVVTSSTLIGVESKRFEPYRSSKAPGRFSDAFWIRREHRWGGCMEGYQGVRDEIHAIPDTYAHLDAAQLVKHALALRTRVGAKKQFNGLQPHLFYLYAEPDTWPRNGKPVEDEAKTAHREEIKHFAQSVEGDEVRFVACSYRELLGTWERSDNSEIRDHARAVFGRFSP